MLLSLKGGGGGFSLNNLPELLTVAEPGLEPTCLAPGTMLLATQHPSQNGLFSIISEGQPRLWDLSYSSPENTGEQGRWNAPSTVISYLYDSKQVLLCLSFPLCKAELIIVPVSAS